MLFGDTKVESVVAEVVEESVDEVDTAGASESSQSVATDQTRQTDQTAEPDQTTSQPLAHSSNNNNKPAAGSESDPAIAN